jgi:hypothetical protein
MFFKLALYFAFFWHSKAFVAPFVMFSRALYGTVYKRCSFPSKLSVLMLSWRSMYRYEKRMTEVDQMPVTCFGKAIRKKIKKLLNMHLEHSQ